MMILQPDLCVARCDEMTGCCCACRLTHVGDALLLPTGDARHSAAAAAAHTAAAVAMNGAQSAALELLLEVAAASRCYSACHHPLSRA